MTISPPAGRGDASASPRPDAPRPDVPALADGIQLIGAQPGSGYKEPPALVRRADGQMIQLTPLLFQVLEAVDGRRTLRRDRRAGHHDVRQAGQRRQHRDAGRREAPADRRTPQGRRLRARAEEVEPAARAADALRRHRPGEDRPDHHAVRGAVQPGPGGRDRGRVRLRLLVAALRQGSGLGDPRGAAQAGAAGADLRGHRLLGRLPRVRPRRRRPPRRLHARGDGDGALSLLAGVLHRRHRLLPARPRAAGSAPTSAASTSTRSSRSAPSASGGPPGTTRCCWSSRPRSSRCCGS